MVSSATTALGAARLRETGISVAGRVGNPDGPPSYSVRTFWPVHGWPIESIGNACCPLAMK